MDIKCSYTKLVDLTELVPHPRNSNAHPEKQIEVLAKLIKNRGMRHPIIVSNLSGYIVAGHGRLEALKLLGVEQAPVDYQDFKNEADEILFLESDNYIAEFAEHDKDKTLENLQSLDIDLSEFDFEEVGLIDFSFEQLAPKDLDGQDTQKDEENQKYIIEVSFANEMDRQDLYDDLTHKGYAVKIK